MKANRLGSPKLKGTGGHYELVSELVAVSCLMLKRCSRQLMAFLDVLASVAFGQVATEAPLALMAHWFEYAQRVLL